jgi:hypothetical protein
MRDHFQTADVQDRALAKWQCITFASVRTAEHADEYDTLRVLFQTGQKIHRALPAAYEAEIHLRDFLLRTCAEEPFFYRITEKPASTSTFMRELLAAAIARHECHIKRMQKNAGRFVQSQSPNFRFSDVTDIGSTENIVNSIDQFYVTRRLPLNAPPSKHTQKKLNPVDSNGLRRTCNGCSSVNHYLLDCPEVTHEKKVMFYDALEQHSQVQNPGEDPSPTATTTGQGPNSNIRFALDGTNVLLSLASQSPSRRALESLSFLGTCVNTGAEVYVARARQYAA